MGILVLDYGLFQAPGVPRGLGNLLIKGYNRVILGLVCMWGLVYYLNTVQGSFVFSSPSRPQASHGSGTHIVYVYFRLITRVCRHRGFEA